MDNFKFGDACEFRLCLIIGKFGLIKPSFANCPLLIAYCPLIQVPAVKRPTFVAHSCCNNSITLST